MVIIKASIYQEQTSKNKFDVKLYLTYNTEDKQIERYIILHGNAT